MQIYLYVGASCSYIFGSYAQKSLCGAQASLHKNFASWAQEEDDCETYWCIISY